MSSTWLKGSKPASAQIHRRLNHQSAKLLSWAELAELAERGGAGAKPPMAANGAPMGARSLDIVRLYGSAATESDMRRIHLSLSYVQFRAGIDLYVQIHAYAYIYPKSSLYQIKHVISSTIVFKRAYTIST